MWARGWWIDSIASAAGQAGDHIVIEVSDDGKGMRAEYMPEDQQMNPVIQDPHRVVQCRTYLLDCRVVARRMHAVGEEHHVNLAHRINPQRRAGEARVAERRGRHLRAA